MGGMAQVFTASLSGLVTDATGGGVPNANVKVRNIETNDVRQTQTGTDGRYTITQLKPGSYEVTVETKGFNQRGEEVCCFRRKVMVWKRDAAPERKRPYGDDVWTNG